MKDSEGVPSYTGPSGVPRGPQKSPLRKIFQKSFFKRGVKTIGNYLICLDPRSCRQKFFFQKLKNFLVGFPRIYPKIISKKKFSERGVKSTGNDLICQDTKPWKQLFFLNLAVFFFLPDGWTNGRTNGQANGLTKRDVESLERDFTHYNQVFIET